jgi:hypothetical protein
MRKVSVQPYEPTIADQSDSAIYPDGNTRAHTCGDTGRNTIRDASFRASGSRAASTVQQLAIRCPITGTACTDPKCGEWCKGSGARSATDICWGVTAATDHRGNIETYAGATR